MPEEDPLAGAGCRRRLPRKLAGDPPALAVRIQGAARRPAGALAALPIDHSVPPVPDLPGAGKRGGRPWSASSTGAWPATARRATIPAEDVTSGLSPYLHFGHVATTRCSRPCAREGWSPARLGADRRARGLVGDEPEAESFLDELVTWRELGYNMAARRPDYDRYESLPDWAQATLAKHAGDPRPELYTSRIFEAGGTHDEIWNAAQRQLAEEGRIHNYLRMLWGKKVLHWSERRGGARPPDRAQQQVRPRRPRSQLLQRHLLVPRPLRPALGAGAAGLRQRALT